MKTIAIVQARYASTRLENKIMMPVMEKPIIKILLMRLAKSKQLDQVVVALAKDDKNNIIKKTIKDLGFEVFEGDELNVLDRFYKASTKYSADNIVRITSDCPMSDVDLIDSMILDFKASSVDYMSNTNPPTYPDGFDVEIFTQQALKTAWEEAENFNDKEHVTTFLINNSQFEKKNITYKKDFSHIRVTLDYLEDYEVIKKIFEYFNGDIYFNLGDVIKLYLAQKDIFIENQKFNKRNIQNTGQKLWIKAKKIIPGGNMLLSKRPEMFLPKKWPAYFSKSKGCEVWDLDGNKFFDLCLMGVGTNILGYSNKEVDAAVIQNINKGNMTTLNCPEEVLLSEKILELHPWADMVRLARTGGEANAIAIRIARAASGKDKIAICGYHGWHDWYLATNIENKENLSSHLLAGLDAKGVPKALKGSVIPFNYNDFDYLSKIVTEQNIGIIKMEPKRNYDPKNNFLQKVRKLASENNIVLIFDECTSGFRETNGGLHKKFDVDPDIAIFGKALGNGYAITSIIGRKEIMDEAQSTFISSTFWGERIGPTAAIKTLEVMKNNKSWETISNMGIYLKHNLEKIAKNYDLKFEVFGIASLVTFIFKSENHIKYKTLITQEMLKKGYLASNNIYVSISHSKNIVDDYLFEMEKIFKVIKGCEDGKDIDSYLDGAISHNGFERLN